VSQIHTHSKKRIKEIFIKKGLLPKEQKVSPRIFEKMVSKEQGVTNFQRAPKEKLEELRRKTKIFKCQLGAGPKPQIPKAVFGSIRKFKKQNASQPKVLARTSLERKGSICKNLEK